MKQVCPKFAIIAKVGGSDSSATPFWLIKREEGVGYSFISSPPLLSLRRVTRAASQAMSHPSLHCHPTSRARTTTKPWVTAAVAPAEPLFHLHLELPRPCSHHRPYSQLPSPTSSSCARVLSLYCRPRP